MTPADAPIFITSAAFGVVCVGALYALHRLRVQPRRVTTATLLFWRQSARPQQAHVLRSRRFAHRRTFVLLVAILLLLAAAIVGDRWGRLGGETRRAIIVIDDGDSTVATDASGRTLLRAMVDASRAELGRLPADVALIAAGPQPTLLVRPGDTMGLIGRRLDGLVPQVGASASSLALKLAGDLLGDREGQIIWYTPQREEPAGLPEDIARRVIVRTVNSPAAVAIVGVTFAPSPGNAAVGTLRVRVVGPATSGATLDAEVDARLTRSQPVRTTTDGGEVAFDQWPADGGDVTLRLHGMASAHMVRFRVPDRRPLTFHFVGDVPTALRLALLGTGTESPSGDIFVAPRGTPVPAAVRAAILVVDDGPSAIAGTRLAIVGDTALGLDLEQSTATDGPAIAGVGTPLVTAGSATVASIDRTPQQPTLLLSRAIVGAGADLPRHAAFPVLLARLCDALIDRPASDPLAVGTLRRAEDPLWSGPADAPDAALAEVADRTMTSTTDTPSGGAFAAGRWSMRWADVVLVGGLALLLVESLLHAAKRIV